MPTSVLSAFAFSLLASTGAFSGVSDADLIPRLAAREPYNGAVVEELADRVDRYPPAQRAALLALLVNTVEQTPDRRVRNGCGSVLGEAAHFSAQGRDVIGAHMQRVILQGDPKQLSNINHYLGVLIEFDVGPETRAAVFSVFEKPALFAGMDSRTRGNALTAVEAFGAEGEQFLVQYFPKDPGTVANSFGRMGTETGFRFLRKQTHHDGKFRADATFGVGSWAENKPAGSRERAKAVKLLLHLACDPNLQVKTTALEALTRMGFAPRSCTRDDDRDDTEDDDGPRH